MAILIIVNNLKDFQEQIPGVEVITAKSYLYDPTYIEMKNARVFNLCRSFAYQSTGYYISLLAAARGHKVFPDITTIQDTKTQSIIRLKSDELGEVIQKSLAKIKDQEFQYNIYFGKATDTALNNLSQQLFYEFQVPAMTAFFCRKSDGRWFLQDVDPISSKGLNETELSTLYKNAAAFFSKRNAGASRKQIAYGYELAILVNPDEKEPPSNKAAIKKFIKAAESVGMGAWTITKDEYNQLAEYDALLIRETTNVQHYTYRFARRGLIEGLVVIDDPDSILRCSNKVYLAELMQRHNIPTPKTMVISKDNVGTLLSHFSFPIILKLPDSAFSMGVKKAKNEQELAELTKSMLDKSDLIIAQEFLPTEFDWRIGILDRKPIYACKYYMADNHWQIMNWNEKGDDKYGNFDTLPIDQVPAAVVETALRAANLIGDGLYGVDMKEVNGQPYLVEVNDNPNIDAGIEDQVLGDKLYEHIMQVFLHRIQKKKNVARTEAAAAAPTAKAPLWE